MELNWAQHFRSGLDDAGGAAPQPPWPTSSADEEEREARASRTDDWTGPDQLPEGPEGEEPEEWAESAGKRLPVSSRPLSWLRQISFRGRVSVLVVAAVGLAVAMAALSSYVAISRYMEQQSVTNLENAAQDVQPNVHIFLNNLDPGPLAKLQLQTGDQVQVIFNSTRQQIETAALAPGSPSELAQRPFFKLTSRARATFGSEAGAHSFQVLTGTDGTPYRVETVSVIKGVLAVQLGYSLANMDSTLAFLRLMLILVALGGVAVAAALGWAVGRASMRPVEDLTLAAERVAETQDLSQKIEDTSNDELGRLARSFNAMLAALAASRQQQAQLVSDAGHELRTPLTSLRTNIEVLMRTKDLPPADRDALLSDVDAQLQELAALVGDLVDLSRDEEKQEVEPELVALDQLVRRAVDRAQRRAMSVHFEVELEAGYTRGQPAMLERAVVNVLDNAAKWSPSGGQIGVRLWGGTWSWHLVVTDQGPGIPAEDLPHIFERFYRAASARSMPGSGLGLAIVKRVVTSHGGTIDVTCAPEGGTRVEIELPLEEEPPAAEQLGAPAASIGAEL